MSVVSRPRVLFLLGALAACGGGDDDVPAGPDAAPALDASVDASVDAAPRTLVMLGSRGVCPRELQVVRDELYWLEGEVLVRSSATSFSPEVVYAGVNGAGLRVTGGAAYWVSLWPVRLDLDQRVARPIVTTPVTGLEIIDGVRPVVMTGADRIAEVHADKQLRDLHTVSSGSLRDLRSGGHWLYWIETDVQGVTRLGSRDAVGGEYGSAVVVEGLQAFAASRRIVAFAREVNGTPLLRVLTNGSVSLQEASLPWRVSRLAVAADESLYLIDAETRRLFHAPSVNGAIGLNPVSTTTAVDEVVAIGDGVIAVTCDGGQATYHRWYP